MTVTICGDPPDTVDVACWDEVVEVSLDMPHGDARLAVLMADVPDTFPTLSPCGPGSYRLRVHARGRDTSIDGTASEPFEDYLIVAWPSPQAPQTIYKETARYGAGWHSYKKEPAAPEPGVPELGL